MKKMILFSALAMMAASASAQYACDPTTEALLEKGAPSKVWYLTLSDTSIETLTKSGANMIYVGPDPNEGRNFWYWENTLIAGPETNPRVGFEDGGYVSLEVTNVGWSGAGMAIDAPGVNLDGLNDNTRFHFAYCTNATAPASVALILLDQEAKGSKPAKFSIGKAAFVDGGAPMPLVSGEITDEWQGVDLSIGDLKKLWPSFNPINLNAWDGNIFSVLAGGVAGTNICFDAMYFYNLGDANAVEGVAEEAALVITEKTVNSSVAGIEVYNLAGAKVAASNGYALGIDALSAGVYVAKSGNSVKKFVVK